MEKEENKMELSLPKFIKITGTIEVKTGLHIGGSSDTTSEIGGMDNPVITNPLTGEPYIPGSSLKGKMRSLLEAFLGKIKHDGTVHACDEPKCEICRIFGNSEQKAKEPKNTNINKDKKYTGPTRILVRDSELNIDYKTKYKKAEKITEVKWENTINRITAEANPRQLERVLPGTKFDLTIMYRAFNSNDENDENDEKTIKEDIELIKKGLKLIELDALGGYGSRGSGQVEIKWNEDEEIEILKINCESKKS